jgi:glycosyltransferase involved in cell wall biosynthesis
MCFSDGAGGMEHDAVKLARLLSKELKVVLLCKKGSFIQDLAKKYSDEIGCEPVGFSSRLFSIAMLVKVHHLLQKYNIGNVIFFGASELKTLHFAFIGFDLNVIVRHGTTKSKPKKDWFHRMVYSKVNYHVALSSHLLNNVKMIAPSTTGADYKIIFQSVEVKANAVEAKNASDELVITHVGRVVPGKGHLDAVHACKALVDAGIIFRLEFLGGVEDENTGAKLEKFIYQNKLVDKVAIRGHVADVGKALAACDIFLFPSYGEGMPNALIEAMHYGLPCLVYNNTVFPEFIEMGFYITLAEDRDVDDLSKKLLAIARNMNKEKAAARGNIKLAKEYFNIDKERESWMEILL